MCTLDEWVSCQTEVASAGSGAPLPDGGCLSAPTSGDFSAVLAADAAADEAVRVQAAAQQRAAERAAETKSGFDTQMARVRAKLDDICAAKAAKDATTDAAEGLARSPKRLRGAAPAKALVASNLPPIVAPPRALGSVGSRANRLGSLYDPLNRHTPKPAWYVRAPPATCSATRAAAIPKQDSALA